MGRWAPQGAPFGKRCCVLFGGGLACGRLIGHHGHHSIRMPRLERWLLRYT